MLTGGEEVIAGKIAVKLLVNDTLDYFSDDWDE